MEQIGRYQILGELGRGAMGVVYRALDPALGRTVAIKCIRWSELSDGSERQALRERLLREAQSAGRLSHPHIVMIYDVLDTPELAYISMEYVNGPTFEQLLTRAWADNRDALLNYLRQVADALDYAHQRGIVHRDIKPANIILQQSDPGRSNEAKITDFGVAKFVSQQRTLSGGMIGTPNYMSPEQIQGLSVDGRADQFSLAVVAYEVLTGQKPFVADNLPTLFYRICREQPAPAERVNPSLSPAVGAAFHRALAKEPGHRYPTCSEFADQLIAATRINNTWAMQAKKHFWSAAGVGAGRAAASFSQGGAALAQDTGYPVSSDETVVMPVGAPAAEPVWRQPVPPRRVAAERDRSALTFAQRVGLLVLLAGVLAALLWLLGVFHFSPHVGAGTSATAGQRNAQPQAGSAAGNGTGASGSAARRGNEVPAGQSVLGRDGLGAAATERRRAAAREFGFVTDPPGARVTVDNDPKLTCVTPCQLSLASGEHTLTAQLGGYDTVIRMFDRADRSIYLPLQKPYGALSIVSEPSGASILIDGKPSGTTPRTLKLPAGDHKITFVNGEMSHDEVATVKPGSWDTLKVVLGK